MKPGPDPFEDVLLRRSYIGIAAFLIVLLLGTILSMIAFPAGQPALGPVLLIRCLETVLLIGGLVWALTDRNLPRWVPPTSLLINCFLALSIVASSQGQRFLSMAVFLVEGAQFLLAFGFFIRRQWITLAAGLALLTSGWVLFFVLPPSTFPQVLTGPELELGISFLMFFGLALITGFVAANNNVAQRIVSRAREAAEQLRIAALRDPATGLPNGLRLEQDLDEWEARGRPGLDPSQVFVLAGFRLDGLEELNETLGVDGTTRVVVDVVTEYAVELGKLAVRHVEVARPAVFGNLYRIDSNLFVFALLLPPGIQPTGEGRGALGNVIDRVVAQNPVATRLDFQGGFTFFPGDAPELRQLLRNLLHLLHSRRPENRGRFVPFDHEHYREHLRREALRLALGKALASREFRLVYQPKVETSSGRSRGFEALARWSTPELGTVSPVDFIPLAEQSGQIAELTRLLLDQAFAFLVELKDSGHPGASVGVNLSPGVFTPEFLDTIIESLQTNGLGPRLDIEITEGVLLRLSGPLHDRFLRLKTLGVTFSIDDFGTGYSNLGYLQNLEADVLKIDKRFIDRIPGDEKNSKLVTAIVQMAHSLGMTVVAEGVERLEQRELLLAVGCDQIQGYYYSRPLEPAAAVSYLDSHGTPG